jgi:hydrophobic/amphiphilic exporter-1 (mainly G- bacteria), HAE1 family
MARLRPILMTSFTAILGVLPLTLGLGQGDELAQPLAVVTFGGLFVSTMLTLLVIPLLYMTLAKWQAGRVAAASLPQGA